MLILSFMNPRDVRIIIEMIKAADAGRNKRSCPMVRILLQERAVKLPAVAQVESHITASIADTACFNPGNFGKAGGSEKNGVQRPEDEWPSPKRRKRRERRKRCNPIL